MRRVAFLILIGAAALAQTPAAGQVTWTGWFSDAGCARGRLTAATLSGNNPECARQCIEKGAEAVFISEQARDIFRVKDYSAVVENLGYKLEISGRVDGTAKTISVQTVKRISEYQGPSCARPKK